MKNWMYSDVSGSVLGTFLDGFGKVLEMSDEVRNEDFQKSWEWVCLVWEMLAHPVGVF